MFTSFHRQCSVARQAEFARACVKRMLEGETVPSVTYYGMFRQHQKPVVSALQSEVFRHWDGLSTSPPQTRPQASETRVTGLNLLSSNAAGRPGWPDHVMEKFRDGSEHLVHLQQMKAKFLEFKSRMPDPAASSAPRRSVVRVTGTPDFTIDSEAQPIDVSRVVDLEKVTPPAAEQRPVFFLFSHCVGQCVSCDSARV